MTPLDAIFEPLEFQNLTVRNRIFRAPMTGRMDHYDGSGTDVRINFEVKHAKTGIGAIISAHTPVHVRGILVPGVAMIDRDARIPFWRELVRRVHEQGCPYIIQLVFSGRQREVTELVQYETGLSSTDKPEFIRGTPCEQMTKEQIEMVVEAHAQAARRAREAGVDGIEINAASGFLPNQFLSKSINERTDEYGGSLENRARLSIEIVRAIRKQVGDDYHVQFKISAVERVRQAYPWLREGNTIEDSIQVCKWLEEAGVDGFHVTTGTTNPHPSMPPGRFPVRESARHFDMFSQRHALGTLLLRTPVKTLFRRRWEKFSRGREEGIVLPDAAALKQAVSVPVICTGGFQTASLIRKAIEEKKCDAVSIARPLLANPDLVQLFAAGIDRPPNPCTYSNKCLINFLSSPIGCYDETRYASREEMVREIMSIYEPSDDAEGEQAS